MTQLRSHVSVVYRTTLHVVVHCDTGDCLISGTYLIDRKAAELVDLHEGGVEGPGTSNGSTTSLAFGA